MPIVTNDSQVVTFESESALERALNDGAEFPPSWKLIAKGGYFTAIGFGGIFISSDAQEVLNNMPGVLTALEEEAIINFVNQLSASIGNDTWRLFDAYANGHLTDPLNKLWKWKQNSAMINQGATLGAGWGVDGIGTYIDIDFIPSIDGVNFQRDNALAGAYVHSHIFHAIDPVNLLGAFSPDPDNTRLQMFWGTPNDTQPRINTAATVGSFASPLEDLALFIHTRNNSSEVEAFKRGVSVGSRSISSSDPNPNSLWLGAVNNNGVYAQGLDGTLSSMILAAANGFDIAFFDQVHDQFLTELGAI